MESLLRRHPPRILAGTTFELVRVKGEIGVLTRRRDGRLMVTAFAIADDRIRAIYTVSNPDKLRHGAIAALVSARSPSGPPLALAPWCRRAMARRRPSA